MYYGDVILCQAEHVLYIANKIALNSENINQIKSYLLILFVTASLQE